MFLALKGLACHQGHALPLCGDRLAMAVKHNSRQAEADLVAGGDETRQRGSAENGC